jgi:hypothetical protein
VVACLGPSLESESERILRFFFSTTPDAADSWELLRDLPDFFEAGDPLFERFETGEPEPDRDLFDCFESLEPLRDLAECFEAGEPDLKRKIKS